MGVSLTDSIAGFFVPLKVLESIVKTSRASAACMHGELHVLSMGILIDLRLMALSKCSLYSACIWSRKRCSTKSCTKKYSSQCELIDRQTDRQMLYIVAG